VPRSGIMKGMAGGWIMIALRWMCVACAVACVSFGRVSAADLPFEIANARTGSVRATFVLADTRSIGGARPVWSRELQIALAAGVATAPTAGLAIDDVLLETEAGVQVIAKAMVVANSFPSELAIGRRAAVTLTATFTAQGLYRGEIVLHQGNLQRIVPVEVNVTAPGPVPFEAEGGHAIAITAPLFGTDDVLAVLQLRNKGHEPVTLKDVELASATRVDKPVNPGMPLQSPNVKLTESFARFGGATEPGAVAHVPIALSGIDEPGIYLVDVGIQAEGHQPEQITVTVYRRKHWLWAVLAIAAGVVTIASVRAFASGGRERLKVRRRLAALRDRLRALRHQAVEPEHETAAAQLSAEIEQRGRELRWVAIGDTAAANDALEQRIELLGEIMSAARQLGRLDEEKRAVPRQVLSQALAKVRIPTPAGDVEVARKAVAELALDEVWRAQLSAMLREVDTQVSVQLTHASPALRAAIVEQVQPLQISAHQFLRQEHLVEVAAVLEGAHTRLREVVVAELRRHATGKPPIGVSEDAWLRACESITQLLEGNVESPAWPQQLLQAQRTYFLTAVQGLAQHAEAKASEVQAGDASRLKAIAAALYRQRLREVTDASEPVAGRHKVSASKGDGQSNGEEDGAWSWISLLLSKVPKRGSAVAIARAHQIEAMYYGASWLVSVAVGVVAVTSGMKALWIGNPTWGTDHAWLIAFLWGAGVGTIGDAFTGIVGLREKLGTPRQ